jgi:peptidoglycan/LPS O-acetylase OafA/YrhL
MQRKLMANSSSDAKSSPLRRSFIIDGLRDLWTIPASQVPALDALRALAIVMVITGHFPDLGKAQFPRYAHLFENPVFSFGWTGVDLFFVLSGYLIGRQLWRERQRTGTVSVGRFLLRRGMRIWPLYLFIALISPMLVGKWSYKWSDWAFLSNYVPGRVDGGWSLSTEEQFYILAPLAILFFSRFLKVRGWMIALLASLFAVSAARWWTAHNLLAAGVSVAKLKTDMYTPFHLHNEGLTVGLMIALIAVNAPSLLNGSSDRNRRVLAVAAIAALAALVLRAANGIVFPFLALALIYGSGVTVLLTFGARSMTILKSRIFYVISRLSYGMYLLHFTVLRSIGPYVAGALKHLGGQNPITVILTLVATVASSAMLATVTFVLIEHPFLMLRDRVLGHSASPAIAPSFNAPMLVPVGRYSFGGERDRESMRAD